MFSVIPPGVAENIWAAIIKKRLAQTKSNINSFLHEKVMVDLLQRLGS
jgi:hypothetical protein